MALELAGRIVSCWRVQKADPRGYTMWFDPSREVPLLGLLPPDSGEELSLSLEAGTQMELSWEKEGVTREGSEAKGTAGRTDIQVPPPGFLNDLWSGSDAEPRERSQD